MNVRKMLLLCVAGMLVLGSSSEKVRADAETEPVVVEVVRGEEEEVTIPLYGTEGVYSLYGVLTGDEDYVILCSPKEKPEEGYQAFASEGDATGKLLLSKLGMEQGDVMRLKLKVSGKRIGTTKLWLDTPQYVSYGGYWTEESGLPEVTIRVLPNPVRIFVHGVEGDNGWYVKVPEVLIEDKDAAIISYALDGGTMKKYTETFTVPDGAWTLKVRTNDGYGYIKEVTERIFVDGIAPAFSASRTQADWQNTPVEVSFLATDSISGVSMARWSVSESKEIPGEWNFLTMEQGYVIEEDGVYYLHLWARDVAGNEGEKVFGPYRKDSVAPELRIVNIQDNEGFTDGVLPEVEATDTSGIKELNYTLDGAEWEPAEIHGRGKHTLTVTAEDMAGNVAEETVTFFIYDTLSVTCTAADTHYTGPGIFGAKVSYEGKPLAGRDVEFYVNEACVGTAKTGEDGVARLFCPVEAAPGTAHLTVRVAQDDARYFAETKVSSDFHVVPEAAVTMYTGDLFTKKGDALSMRLKVTELPDEWMGDITNAVYQMSLFFIEEDGSRTLVETWTLSPREDGVLAWEGTYETGLYELVIEDAEESFYKSSTVVVCPAVYDISAEWEDSTGTLLIDLPHLGVRILSKLEFSPKPALSAEVKLRIPGTGIVLTENEIESWDLSTEGLELNGRAVNPKDGEVCRYQIKAKFSFGLLVTGLEAYVWEGEAPEGDTETGEEEEPVYQFRWQLDGTGEGLSE